MNTITEEELRKLVRDTVRQYQAKGRTQKDLANEIGIPPSQLSGIINHGIPISDTVANFFGRELVKLYREIDD